jgi:predicted RND superfamily exporter protein
VGTLIAWASRRPRTVLAACAVVALLSLAGTVRLQNEEDLMVFLPTDDPDVRLFEDVSHRFGSLRVALIGVETPVGDDVFSPSSMVKIDRATQAIKNLRGVDLILSLTAASDIVPGPAGAQVVDLVPAPPKDAAGQAALRARVLSREFAVGNLVSKDGRAALILAFLADPKKGGGGAGARIEDQIRTVATHELAGLHVYFGGAPFAARAIYEEAQRDVWHLSPVALVMLLLVVIIAFRDPLGVALTVGSVAFSVLVVLGGMGWLGEKFTVATSTLPVILFASGSSYAVHVLGRYYLLRATRSSDDAIKQALAIVGPPLAIAAATTSVGFFAFVATDVRPMRGFGLACGAGVVVCWLASLTLVPAALALWPRRAQQEIEFHRLGNAMVRLWHWSARCRTPIMLTALVVGALSIGPMLRVRVRMEPRAFFRVGSEPWLAEHFLDEHFGGATFAQIWLSGDFDDPATLREVARLSDFTRSLPGVHDVQSLLLPVTLASAGMNGRAVLPWKRAQSANLWLLIEGQAGVGQLITSERRDAMLTIRVSGDAGPAMEALEGFVRDRLQHQPKPPTLEDVADRLGWMARTHDHAPPPAALLAAAHAAATPSAPSPSAIGAAVADYLRGEEAPPMSEAARADIVRLAAADPAGSPALRDAFVKAGATPEDYTGLLGRLDEERRRLAVEAAVPALIAAAELPPDDAFVRAHVATLADDLFVHIDPAEHAEVPLVGHVAGEPILGRGFSRAVGDNQVRSLVVTVIAVLLLMLALFRSLKLALLSMWASLLTMAIIFGVMGLAGVPIDLGTSLVAGIATGAGSDFAMHYLWYLRRQPADEVTRTVGPIMVVSILLVSLGFWVLALGKSPAMHLFGTLAGLSMALSAFLTCLLVPAVLSKARTPTGEPKK